MSGLTNNGDKYTSDKKPGIIESFKNGFMTAYKTKKQNDEDHMAGKGVKSELTRQYSSNYGTNKN